MVFCIDFCLCNLDGILGYLLDKEILWLYLDIFLFSEICDWFVNEYVELVNVVCNFELYESFFSFFLDFCSICFMCIYFCEDLVQDQDLEVICKQDLVELYLINCEKLFVKSLQILRSFSYILVFLSFFGCINIFYEEENLGGCEDEYFVNFICQVLVKDFIFEGFSCFCFFNLGCMIDWVFVEFLLWLFNFLVVLDFLGIQMSDVVFFIQWKDSLVFFVFYNMDLFDDYIWVIVQLYKL